MHAGAPCELCRTDNVRRTDPHSSCHGKTYVCYLLHARCDTGAVGHDAMADQAKADALGNRLIHFAVCVIKLADALPKTPAGTRLTAVFEVRHFGAPNDAEACVGGKRQGLR